MYGEMRQFANLKKWLLFLQPQQIVLSLADEMHGTVLLNFRIKEDEFPHFGFFHSWIGHFSPSPAISSLQQKTERPEMFFYPPRS